MELGSVSTNHYSDCIDECEHTHLLILYESILLSQGNEFWTVSVLPVGPELVPCEFRVTFEVMEYLDACSTCSLACHLPKLNLIQRSEPFIASDTLSRTLQARKLLRICDTTKNISTSDYPNASLST